MKFRISRLANKDLESIWHYIALESPAAADRVEASLHEAMKLLSAFPGIGHIRRDVSNPKYRFFAVYDYLIAYRQHGRTIIVVRVLHGRRDVRRFFDGKR